MKLWELHSAEGHRIGYDAAHGFVVRAEHEVAARALASRECGDGDPGDWLDPEKTTCDELLTDGASEVVLCHYVSG